MSELLGIEAKMELIKVLLISFLCFVPVCYSGKRKLKAKVLSSNKRLKLPDPPTYGFGIEALPAEVLAEVCEFGGFHELFPLMLCSQKLYSLLTSMPAFSVIQDFHDRHRVSVHPLPIASLEESSAYVVLHGGLQLRRDILKEAAKLVGLSSSNRSLRIASKILDGLDEAERSIFTEDFLDYLVSDHFLGLAEGKPWQILQFAFNLADFKAIVRPLTLGCDRLTLVKLVSMYARPKTYMDANRVSLEWHRLFDLSPSLHDRVLSIALDLSMVCHIFSNDKACSDPKLVGMFCGRLGEMYDCLGLANGHYFSTNKSLAEAMSEHDQSKHLEVITDYLMQEKREFIIDQIPESCRPPLSRIISTCILFNFQTEDLLVTVEKFWPFHDQECFGQLLQVQQIVKHGARFVWGQLVAWQQEILPHLSLCFNEEQAKRIWENFVIPECDEETLNFVLDHFVCDGDVAHCLTNHIYKVCKLGSIPEDKSIYDRFTCKEQCLIFFRATQSALKSSEKRLFQTLAKKANDEFDLALQKYSQ